MPLVELRFGRLDLCESEVARLHGMLGRGEQERASRFRFARDRRRFIVRRGKLREWLGEASGRAPAHIAYVEGPFGKPEVAGWTRHFSASHSGETMMIAVAECPIGCDIEAEQRDLDWRPLADRLFAEDERAALSQLGDSEGRASFFRCWSRKEAFVKAVGQGLSYPLDAFTVSVGEQASLLSGGEGWVLAAHPLPGFGCAIAAADDGTPLRFVERAA